LKNKNFTLSHLYIIAVLLFLFLPVLIIIFFSFCNSSSPSEVFLELIRVRTPKLAKKGLKGGKS